MIVPFVMTMLTTADKPYLWSFYMLMQLAMKQKNVMIAQEEYFEVYAPTECNLNEDDLLIRILYDKSPNIDEPYVFVLQVKEVLGTFGYSSLLWKKCLTTLKKPNLKLSALRFRPIGCRMNAEQPPPEAASSATLYTFRTNALTLT